MAKIIISLCIVVTLTINPTSAQINNDNQDVDTQFKLALNLYETLQYNDALKIFRRLSTEREFNSKTTISFIFTSKCLLNLEKYNEAEEVINNFREKYPNSNYKNEALLTLAKIKIETGEYLAAFRVLLNLIKESNERFYINYSKETGEKIALNYLSDSQLSTLIDNNTNQDIVSYLLLELGKLQMLERNYNDARTKFLKIIQDYPTSDEREEAAELYKKALESTETVKEISNKIILAMLPLSGDIQPELIDAAKEVLAGFKYAIDEYNNEHNERIALAIENTEMNKDRIQEIKNIIEAYPEIQAVLGPLFSVEVRDALNIFNETEIPIISPTATDNDLTFLNDNFFQANPNFEMRGRVMAQYVYYVENKRKMAVLNAIESYSPILAGSFVDEFTKLGGEIIDKESYQSNSFSLSTPISNIAKDSLEIEGIYIPLADKIDVPSILSELVQNNLNIPIYGNQDWFQAKGFETSSKISNQLIFTSDYFIDYNNPAYSEFNKNFIKTTGKDANRNSLYGYDSGKYILSVLMNVKGSRDAVLMKMKSGFTSTGYHNNISFGENRVNKFLNIVRYKNGQFELIDKFKGG